MLGRFVLPACETYLDIGGNGRELALALYRQNDCDLILLDLDPKGALATPHSPWVEEYRNWLIAEDVDPARIITPGNLAGLRPADVVTTFGYFGDTAKIKHLKPIMARVLHADSRMFLDIRKGSGAFPFLKEFGDVEIISESEGGAVRHVMFSPAPPQLEADDSWSGIATGLAGANGFFRDGPKGHSFLYVPRNKKVLVVTFDNLDIAMNKREARKPWGYEFIEKQGWSMLAALAGGWTWYREPWVSAQFDDLRSSGFFTQFDRVVFYGASMGGYAAAAFSAACPGADVVAISPQSTLDKRLVPFETRYKTAWHSDFSGPYGDATEASISASRVTILYDPYEPLDSGHVRRFTGANVLALRCPLLGHRLGSSLSQMGILSPIIIGALDGTLTEAAFYKMLRARRDFPRYHKELFDRLRAHGHNTLATQLGRWVLKRGDNRHIRRAMKEMERAVDQVPSQP